jgi:hypothetical protein
MISIFGMSLSLWRSFDIFTRTEKERQEDSAKPQSPTQAKERLEWATRPSATGKKDAH